MLIAYGTRPEFIKIKPLIKELNKRNIQYKTLFTGQHMNITFNKADYNLKLNDNSENRLDSIVKSCLDIPDKFLKGVKYILVQGDTSSVLGLSILSMHRNIKLIHLEAGLRSYDIKNPFPEENNRRIVSTIADIHLCPTEENKKNLIKENIKKNIFINGA